MWRSKRSGRAGITRLSLCVVILGGILASVAAAQLPSMPQMPGMAGPSDFDLAEMERRLRQDWERCQGDQAGTGPYDVAFCNALRGLGGFDADRAFSPAHFEAAQTALEGAGDHLGRILLYLMAGEAAAHFRDTELSRRSLDQGLAVLGELRDSEAPISPESLDFFARLGGMPEEILEQIKNMMPLMRPFFLNQFELMMRLRQAQHLFTSDPDAAESHLARARHLSSQLMGVFDAPVLELFGRLREEQGRIEEAKALYLEAAEAAGVRGDHAHRDRLEQRVEALGPRRLE